MQRALILYLARYRDSGLEAWPEQRLNISDDHYRVCDVCVTGGEPEAQIFTGAWGFEDAKKKIRPALS